MSLSDLFNISRTVRRDKAQAQDLLPVASSSKSLTTRLCNICYDKPATYNCPRCNVPFCSLACFRRQEHQNCSAAFASSSALSLDSGTAKPEADEGDRSDVVNILHRLERDEKEARQRQEDAQEDEDSDNDEGVRLDVTAEQIEAASTDELLAVLPQGRREKLLEALKSPQSAKRLMERLDRKASRRTGMDPSEPQQGALIAAHLPTDGVQRQRTSKPVWQSTSWFERPEATPGFGSRSPENVSAFVTTIETILATTSTTATARTAPPTFDLVYNLCAALMAYVYTLRRLDVESLSQTTEPLVAGRVVQAASSASAQMTVKTPEAQSFSHGEPGYDDDEPPPLEPDDPISFGAAIPQLPGSQPDPPAASEAQNPDAAAIVVEALEKLESLLPFLFSRPSPAASNDPSKVVLTSLEDASMWLLSRLPLESEVGQGGADAINLQLLEDLNKLLAGEQLIPTFDQEAEIEPRYWLVSELASLPPQQAFAAAQTPLIVNAAADLYFFLDDIAVMSAIPASPLSRMPVKAKVIKLAQRKLCFYLCSAVLRDQSGSERAISRLSREVRHDIERLRQRIDAESKADKLAAAVKLLDKDMSHMSRSEGSTVISLPPAPV